MVADLYLCWAHYYDYCDNFEKAESVYRKGLDARAQPIELIEQAHKQFGFQMSQRLLYKDESTQRKFRSTMEEQRLALTSLRAQRHRFVGSIRTGSAVKSLQPGRVEQHDSSLRQSNRKVQVFEDAGDAPTSPTASTSVVQSILNSTKKQENLREPGPWNKAKVKQNALFSGASSSKPSFPILEDDDFPPIPLADSENNYARGIQLPKDFVRRNLPQDEFLFPIHRDEEPAKNTIYRYDKFMVFPAPDKCYSLEELWAYKWLKKRNIKNNFTRTQDTVWENGYGIPIRLPPHFARKNSKQDDWTPEPINHEEVLANGQRKFGFKIDLIYTSNEEFSPEEILQSKWLNGELMSQIETDMELTCNFDRRVEISNRNANRRSMVLGGRKSILPRRSVSPRKSMSARKSLAPPSLPEVIEEPKATDLIGAGAAGGGAISRTCLPKRKSIYTAHTLETLSTIPEAASPPIARRKIDEDSEVAVASSSKPNPVPFSIFEDCGEQTERDEQVFKVPQSAPLQKTSTRISTGFQDEDLDGCTTQTFNFFIKSQAISTPKVDKQHAKLAEPESVASLKKGLDFGSDYETSPDDEQNAIKQPFTCRSTDVDQPYVIEQNEIYRQKLSAIMETTEECATVSSLAATASSKSSSAEDFEFTKHTNHQSSVAMTTYRQHTIVNNTAKMSSSNVSVTNRENETKKGIGFEIYQEDEPKGNDTVASQMPAHASKIADSSTAMTPPADLKTFDKTLPPAAQFHIYQDDDTKVAEPIETEPNANKVDTTLVNKPESPNEKPDQSVFEMSQSETVPSAWNSMAPANKNVSIATNKSTVQPIATNGVPATKSAHDFTLPTGVAGSTNMPPKSGFNVFQEDTGLTMPAINFAEERTVQMPTQFNQSNMTQMMPPEKTETISMYMPEIPDDDATKNISNMFKNHVSRAEPTNPINQSSIYNQSVFQFPVEDTVTNVFSTNFHHEKFETNPNIPNPMQISLFNAGGNSSAIPMIPDMPTLPEIDFQSEAKATAANQTKLNSTQSVGNKTNANLSLFQGFTNDVTINVNQSQTIQEQKANDLSKMDSSKRVTGFAEAQPAQNVSAAAQIPKGMEDLIATGSIANKTATKSSQNKTSIDDEFIAMADATQKQSPATNARTLNIESEKTRIEKTQPVTEASESVAPTIHVSPEKQSPTMDNNQSIFSKSKHTIDDEFYAMIRSPVRKAERTLAEGMIYIDTPSPQPQLSVRQEIAVEPKPNPPKISLFQNPSASSTSMSLLEPIKNTSTVASTNRKSSFDDVPRAFSEENPNTAMFSLHMPFIKNSTILMASHENINEISDELKTNFTITEEAPAAKVQGKQTLNV